MGFNFDNFSTWDNISGQKVDQSGPSAKNTDGNSYSKQSGDSTSLQFGNKNSFQHGISNSALMGLSFSTNVAASTSTFVGAKFSFELAASATVSAAAKLTFNKSIECVHSTANKYTLHSGGSELNAKKKETSAQEAKKAFIAQVDEWYNDHHTSILNVVTKVLKGDMQYGALKTTVATNDTKDVVGTHKITAMQHKFSVLGNSLEINPSGFIMTSVMSARINGAIINIG